MPTYLLKSLETAEVRSFRVYAIDGWDARDQVERSLGIPASNEQAYSCEEIGGLRLPLDIIVHDNGTWTNVLEPEMPGDPQLSFASRH